MEFLVLEELELLDALLLLHLLSLAVALLDGLDLGLELDDLVLELGLLGLELLNLALEVGLAVLGLQLLPHGESDGALVQGLVSGDGHLDLIADSQEEEAALGLIQGHLSDDLVEALREELLAHGADATLAGLTLHKLLIELLSEACDIYTRRLLVRDVGDVMLSILNPLLRREDGIQDVLGAWLGLHGGQLSLLSRCYRLG